MKTRWNIAQLLLCTVVLAACGNDLTWTEDAKLPDGRVITLKRWVEFKGGSSHLGDPSTESRQTFEFKHPTTGQNIQWENTLEQGRLKTIALWLDKDKPQLLTEPAYGGDSIKYNCPNPPYLLHEYVASQWRAKPLAQVSLKSIRANLTTHPLETREMIERNRQHLTAAQTSDSYTYRDGVHKVPYVIQFEGMAVQTFKEDSCNYPSKVNYLLQLEEK
jgi:hypothetical protein